MFARTVQKTCRSVYRQSIRNRNSLAIVKFQFQRYHNNSKSKLNSFFINNRNTKRIPLHLLKNPNNLMRNEYRMFSVTTVNVPNMGDSITEGTLVEWSKNVGDSCQVDDIVAVIETDKVSIDVRTDFAGVITEQLAQIDDTLEVNAPLFKIDTDAQTTPTPPTPTPIPTETAQTATETVTETTSSPPPPPPPPPPSPPKTQVQSTPTQEQQGRFVERKDDRVQMSRMRMRIAERLMEAQSNTASLTTFNEIDMSGIMSIRNKYKDLFLEKHGIKLGFMSCFVSASCKALEFQPSVNAYIDGKDIVYRNYSDISIAVASPTGLVVPVIQNANQLNLAEIESEIMKYAQKAKNGTLTLQEMTGGTFTISNGGVFGSLFGTPIINPPQSAILGMHGTFVRPKVDSKGNVVVKPMMYVALTYDHRIIDGREAVLFLKKIKECVEDPIRLLLNV